MTDTGLLELSRETDTAETAGEALSEREVRERVEILRSLRRYLIDQRRKFRSYLDLLEREEQSILSEDVERLHEQAQMEASIVREIAAVQKVIDPLEQLYRIAYPEEERSIPPLQAGLCSLKQRMLEKNARNRSLLRGRMDKIRQEIKSLRKRKPLSPFARQATGSLVDLST